MQTGHCVWVKFCMGLMVDTYNLAKPLMHSSCMDKFLYTLDWGYACEKRVFTYKEIIALMCMDNKILKHVHLSTQKD